MRLVERLMASMRTMNITYRQNILISQQDKLIPLPVSTVAFFYVDGRQVTATTLTGKEYRVDMTLDELQEQLNPVSFFRVNRQYIVQHVAVKELTQWFSGKYVLGLSVAAPEKIVIPKAKVTPLKEWLAVGE
ncbi:MAG: LytTR family DNA-binding domain-containing protein, partial [Rikenellaceae bacterium]